MEEKDKQPEETLDCIRCYKPMKCTRKYSHGSDWDCENCGAWRRKIISFKENK